MANVLVTRSLPAGSLEPLEVARHQILRPHANDQPLSRGELLAAVAGVDGIVCLLTDRIDREVLEAAGPGLRVVANVAVGYDNIDVAAADALGITVCNTPGVLDETTADLAFALILASSRLAGDAERDLREGRWPGWNINQYLGRDVHGATLGVVGWGRIGQAVARRAIGFGMQVRHHARTPSGDPGYVGDLDELLATADVVTLHVPLGPSTHHLIDDRRLRLMQPTAVLVNTSRGPIIDEAALADALHAGRLFAAGLDVFEHEPAIDTRLLTAPRTVLLPHIGSASTATRVAMGRLACHSVVEAIGGGIPATAVTSAATRTRS